MCVPGFTCDRAFITLTISDVAPSSLSPAHPPLLFSLFQNRSLYKEAGNTGNTSLMTCDSGGGGFVCRCEGCGELPVGPCRGVEDGEEEAEEDVVVVMDEAL